MATGTCLKSKTVPFVTLGDNTSLHIVDPTTGADTDLGLIAGGSIPLTGLTVAQSTFD